MLMLQGHGRRAISHQGHFVLEHLQGKKSIGFLSVPHSSGGMCLPHQRRITFRSSSHLHRADTLALLFFFSQAREANRQVGRPEARLGSSSSVPSTHWAAHNHLKPLLQRSPWALCWPSCALHARMWRRHTCREKKKLRILKNKTK